MIDLVKGTRLMSDDFILEIREIGEEYIIFTNGIRAPIAIVKVLIEKGIWRAYNPNEDWNFIRRQHV